VGKCLAGALSLAMMLVLLVGLCLGLHLAPPDGMVIGLALLCLAGVAGFGWGLLFSSLARSVLAAIGLAILIQWLVVPFAFVALGLVVGLVWLATGWQLGAGTTGALTSLLWLVLPLPLSALVYSTRDRQRRPLALPAARRLTGWWEGWRQVVWLSWAQARGLLPGLLLFSLVAGLLAAFQFALAWPVITLLIGALCGVTMFIDEQSGAYRFLGDQRIPLARLWVAKIIVRLAIGLMAALVLALPAIGLTWVEVAQSGGRTERPLGSYLLIFLGSPGLFAIVWLAYGFACGHLCGLLFRKSLVAITVAIGLGIVLASIWVPSFAVGGLTVWQVLSVPAVLMGCAWLTLYAWASDRVASRQTAVRLVLAALLCLCLTALGLWYRVAQVPDVPEPQGFQAFMASLPAAQENPAGRTIQSVCERLSSLERQWAKGNVPGPLFPGKRAVPGSELGYPSQCSEVIEHGWPDGKPPLAGWLDDLFKDESWGQLGSIVNQPPGVVQDPRRLHIGSIFRYLEPARLAGRLLAARGLEMQKMSNRPEVFVANLEVALALARNLENDAPTVAVSVARAIEATQLDALDRWLEQLAGRPDLLRRVLSVLRAHEAQAHKSATTHRLADYLIALNNLDSPEEWLPLSVNQRGSAVQTAELSALALAWQVPWERARLERLVRWQFAGQGMGERWVFSHHFLWPLARRNIPFRDAEQRWQCRLIAAELTVALRLYQVEKGKLPATLEALVPAYLPKVPADPFGGGPFHYRLSRGEEIVWPALPNAGPAAEPARRVEAGQGILWSTGEDREDNGGTRRCYPLSRCAPGEDIIFLVPLLARRK
jgi:hypothetical protein